MFDPTVGIKSMYVDMLTVVTVGSQLGLQSYSNFDISYEIVDALVALPSEVDFGTVGLYQTGSEQVRIKYQPTFSETTVSEVY